MAIAGLAVLVGIDPDPGDAPYQRGLGERRADALDDLCRAALDPDDTRWGATADDDDVSEWEDIAADDTFDGWARTGVAPGPGPGCG